MAEPLSSPVNNSEREWYKSIMHDAKCANCGHRESNHSKKRKQCPGSYPGDTWEFRPIEPNDCEWVWSPIEKLMMPGCCDKVDCQLTPLMNFCPYCGKRLKYLKLGLPW